ncbi:hypothetical protein ACFYMO_15740 [Streptomyces sp. NPDC007025]|uniref:hypothetical protein n=1 Tax=Streptomyces sp. NPDC007025 TaxID=3364771 RepID=UPI0036BAB13D
MSDEDGEQVAAELVVLRRTSWPVLFGAVLLGSGISVVVVVCKLASTDGFRTIWQAIPIYLFFAGVIGRIANCKIVLRGDALLVINPLRTHILPKRAIHGVSTADDGTLMVHLGEGRNFSAYAFGGSLIDHFRRTSSKAERKISEWLRSSPAVSVDKATQRVCWTRCALADLSFALCTVTSGVSAIWMALSE